jgi:hypothetical protein
MNAFTHSFVACVASTLLLSALSLAPLQSGSTPANPTPPAQTPPSGTSKPADPAVQSGTTKPADAPTPSTDAKPAQATGPADARTGAADKDKTNSTFTQEQIEQMVAPIALYPDGLLVQIMMAATYPLEVVEAQRWVEKNPKLTGKALEDALVKQTWDPSVKSMCGFPDLIKRMSTNLDWLQDLGDAFLGQKKEMLDACQKLRKIAYDSGNLKTTEQQKVVVETDKTIVIQSANPEVIYVPTYSPTVVYAGWSYPTYYYPPMYPAYPPGYGAMAFTAGVFWGAAIWGGCNWGHSDVNINVNRQNNFNRVEHNNINGGNRGQGNQSWQHNPEHRQGVNYRDSKTAQQFGGQAGNSRVSRDAARGYADRGGASASQRPASGTGNRGGASASQRPAGGAGAAQRPAGGASAAQRPAGGSASAANRAGASSRGSSGALSGSSNASLDRAASSRGASSRGASQYSSGRSSGGGRTRGGSGGRGGGGRR